MQGFGVHTFRMINEEGRARFVKFHWTPTLGVHSLVWDEVQKLAGKDPDFNRRDLWENIEMGNYPEFELGVQVIEPEDEFKFDFDLLDPTKIIPEEEVPVRPLGKMVLNRNPDNFFAETEQVAFHPAHVVPGIDFTNDPLLQGRLFSYLDTQLIRLGGPNFQEIPINRPVVEVHNNQRDGYMRQTINRGRSNYFPNSTGGGCPMTASAAAGGYVHYMEKVEGHKIRERSESFRDFYSQATLFWNSMSDAEKQHIVEASHFELGKVEDMEIRARMVDLFNHVDHELARRVAMGIGVDPPRKAVTTNHGKRSPAVSQEHTVKTSAKSRKVAMLLADGFDARQFTTVKQALSEAGATPVVVSKLGGMVTGDDGKKVKVEKMYVTTGSIMYDAVFVPGGRQAVEALKTHGDAKHFINEAFKHCKPIGATGEGAELLGVSDIAGVKIAGPQAEGHLVSDKGVVSLWNASDLRRFSKTFVEAIAMHRFWERDEKEQVPA
jgi:catalase